MTQKDEWLIAESIDGDRQYLVHNLPPRFVGLIVDNDEGGSDVTDIEFIDKPIADAQKLARLMREGGDALVKYDRRLHLDD